MKPKIAYLFSGFRIAPTEQLRVLNIRSFKAFDHFSIPSRVEKVNNLNPR